MRCPDCHQETGHYARHAANNATCWPLLPSREWRFGVEGGGLTELARAGVATIRFDPPIDVARGQSVTPLVDAEGIPVGVLVDGVEYRGRLA